MITAAAAASANVMALLSVAAFAPEADEALVSTASCCSSASRPAGKTTIASMLALAAVDKWGALMLKLDHPGGPAGRKQKDNRQDGRPIRRPRLGSDRHEQQVHPQRVHG